MNGPNQAIKTDAKEWRGSSAIRCLALGVSRSGRRVAA